MRATCRPQTVTGANRRVLFLFAGMNCLQAFMAACLLLVMASGCGHGDRPPLGIVHGTVTLDGKPLAGASLAFQPVEVGRASAGMTDDDGKYELSYIRRDKGAKVGAHLVRISATRTDTPQLLPSRYNTQSTLKAEVKPGDNVIDFSLTSK